MVFSFRRRAAIQSCGKERRPCAWRALLLGCLLWPPIGAYAQSGAQSIDADALHEQALAQARAGELEPALITLESLVRDHPERKRYLHDYITVLGWAERDAEALALLPRLDPATAPFYVLESLAKSARNLRRYARAAALYRGVLERAPQRRAARVGLALTLADMGEIEQARKTLSAWPQDNTDTEILAARAYVALRGSAHFEALQHYERLLQQDPGNGEARRGRLFTLARLGAPHLALAMARSEPGLLSEEERDAIAADAGALDIRWSRLPHDRPAVRQAELAKAIAGLETRLRRLERQGRGATPPARRMRFDLMVAYLEDQRPAEVIARYEALAQDDRPLPPYVLGTAAAAYLQLRRPERALALLREALERDPRHFDHRLLEIYALVESESFDEALSKAEALAAALPPWVGKGPPAYRRPNAEKVTADLTAALVHAFADHLQEAQQRLQDLSDRAPHNADLRSELATVLRWRGLSRRALEEYTIAATLDPRLVSARAGKAHALWDRMAWRQGERLLRELQREAPGHHGVRDLARRWRLHNRRQLILATGYDESSGVTEGGENFVLDAWLYDRPRGHRHRFFLRSHLARAAFTKAEGRYDYRRAGLGWEYRRQDLELNAELSRNLEGGIDAGLGLRLDWQAGDHWRLGAAYDSHSNEVPLRGRLNEGIEGWGANLEAAYVFHESRRIDAGLQYLDFTDGNRRRSARAGLFQRLRSEPHYKLDARADLYTSRNDRRNASYFNPRRDLSLDLTLVGEWLQFRRYERSFRHRFEAGAGIYEQQGFGSGPTWNLRYEQQWNPNERLELRYGISRARRLYDGNAEYITRFDLSLDWRF